MQEKRSREVERLPDELKYLLSSLVNHNMVSTENKTDLFEQVLRYWWPYGGEGLKRFMLSNQRVPGITHRSHEEKLRSVARRASYIFAESWKDLCTSENGKEKYQDWLHGYIASGGEVDYIRERDSGEVFFIPKTDIVLTPLWGSFVGRHQYIIIPEDVEVKGDPGHITLCFLEGYSKKGTVELFEGMVGGEE